MFKNAFNNVISKCSSECYIAEFNINRKCIKCADSKNMYCEYCYGTGNKLERLIKTNVFIDKTPQNIPSSPIKQNSDIEMLYYRDIRHLYISGNIDISTETNVNYIVLIVDKKDKIKDILLVNSIEPIYIDNEIVYYSCVLSNNNINNDINKQIYQKAINRNKK